MSSAFLYTIILTLFYFFRRKVVMRIFVRTRFKLFRFVMDEMWAFSTFSNKKCTMAKRAD